MARVVPPAVLGERLSWSQIHQLVPEYELACPRQYAYQRVARLPITTNASMAAGSAFDEGLNVLLRARIEGRPEGEALELAWRAAAANLEQRLARLPEPPDQERAAAYAAMIEVAIADFAKERADLVPAAVQVEHSYTVRMRDRRLVTVVGWSDRIDRDGTIVDHKFSGMPRWRNGGGEWDQAWVRERRDQLCLYWLARRAEARRGLPQPAPVVARARLEVMYQKLGLASPQLRSLELEFGEEDEQRALAALRVAYETIAARRFPARPGPACRWCSFRERCTSDEERRGTAFAELTATAPNGVAA